MPAVLRPEEHKLSQPAPLCVSKTVVHTGREAVLSRSRELEDLGERTCQLGAMHGLSLLLNREQAARKLPRLVCLHAQDGTLAGAVLLFEYQCGRWPTGTLASGDRFGVRSLIADHARRFEVAHLACKAMLDRGARVVMLSFKSTHEIGDLAGAKSSDVHRIWAIRTRVVQDHLPLSSTVDETLAGLGKRTRTHLRYYQRRLEKTIPCTFDPDAAAAIDASEPGVLEQLNQGSLNRIRQEEFDLQFRAAANLPGGFINGLRTAEGKWLALIGGWRQKGITWVQWQANAVGYPGQSLGTALRAYLLEDEVARGTKRLVFHGGTSHTMSHAFPLEQVVDLVALRPGLWRHLLTSLLPGIYRRFPSLAQRGNLLGDVLRDEDLQWFNDHELKHLFDPDRQP